MRVTRKREREQPLAEFPGWGLEIMMGLYGEEQVKNALVTETAHPARRRTTAESSPGPERLPASEAAEFDAVTSLFARVRRFRHGR